MTRRNRTLMLQFVLAMAVCGLVGILDRPVIGLVGVAICIAIFGMLAFHSTDSRFGRNARSKTVDVALGADEETASSALGTRSYNPRNPAFPLYYPPAERD